MISKTLKAAVAAAFVLTTASSQAQADNLGAALVGGIIGGALLNEANKNKRRPSSSGVSSFTRQQNRETQTALNYFGFPAGTPDGVLGSRSRSAISQYQVYMSFPATGRLTPYERDFLVSSYSRAQIGGPQVIKAMQSPQGSRGLLLTWRDEATGQRTASTYGGVPVEVSEAIDEIANSSDPSAEQLLQRSGFMQLADLNGDGRNDYILDTSVTGSSFWCGDTHCSVMVFASSSQGYNRNEFQARDVTPASFSCHQTVCRISTVQTATAPAPTPAPAPAPQPALPEAQLASNTQGGTGLSGIQTFNLPGTQQAAAPSLTSYCGKINLLTNSNGGFVTAATMTDPDLALGEQFCFARTYAVSNGESTVAKLNGVSNAQVDAQCDAFGPALQPYVAMLGTTQSDAVIAELRKMVLQSNNTIENLANTAQICLFSGYRRDDMTIALGSALLLVGVGQAPYAELVGHHMSQGFGVASNTELAQSWYGTAVAALEAGAVPVFAPGQPERVGLIKAASAGLSQTPAPIQASGGAALPTFSFD